MGNFLFKSLYSQFFVIILTALYPLKYSQKNINLLKNYVKLLVTFLL